ncbi:pleiotropic drug resistance protein 2-like [Wolffia australiana]
MRVYAWRTIEGGKPMASPEEFTRSASSSRRSWGGLVSGSFRELGGDPSDVFNSRRHADDDEADLRAAALNKLPGSKKGTAVDLDGLGNLDGKIIIDRVLQVVQRENERLLRHMRKRIDSVGIEMPKIEIRFENLSVEADAFEGTRALPTLINSAFNAVEDMINMVGVSLSKKSVNKILTDVSGVIHPSRLALLLGPPGSGKTTLLLALAGKLEKSLRVSGQVTYCGHKLNEFVPQRTSAYISQRDLHLGEMTVRETLDFSGRCLGVGTRYDMLSELARREKEQSLPPDPEVDAFMRLAMSPDHDERLVTEYILKMLGLDICADILVGDEMRRGISGGQKKRVTTGEMLVGPARALFMDEISNGLDTSTTFQITKFMRQIVQTLDATVLITLLQPAPETFDLFDDVILLSEGKIVYQGPREEAVVFFEFMGFKCPPRKAVADFLQEVTSRKDQRQYWSDEQHPYRYISVDEFVHAFDSFKAGQQLRRGLSTAYDKSKTHPAALSKNKYGAPKWEIFKACLEREWLLMKRNSFVFVFKTCQLMFLAGLGSSVFPRSEMPHETIADAAKFLGALFYCLVTVMFNGVAEISLTIQRLPVHYKQRDLLLYPGWAFGLPIWLLRIPVSFIESAIWIIITYYSIGFAPSPSRFFRQFLALFLTHQLALGLFRLIGTAGRSFVAANSFGTFCLVVVFILSGFVISKDDLGEWWIWGYWTSPMMYAQNAVAIAEFLDPRWSTPINDSSINAATVGTAILKARGLFVDESWYWISIGALFLLNIIYNLAFLACSSYLDAPGESRPLIPDREGEKEEKGLSTLEPTSAGENGIPKAGMVLPFKPLSLVFHHLNYYVDMPPEMASQGVQETRLQLLRDVSGAFRPGVLTALVGVSGAGKTTLMDVLAGRKTGGYIEGCIFISGYPKNQATFARISGYCEQNDIHSPNITVYESLVFSAWLRLPPEVSPQTQKMFVEEVMGLIELEDLRDMVVGLPGVNGLSTEQRKRFTVAVELVANPSIIFMDEPTSGLDARSAAIVMRAVRNIVNTGRTVVCTIHQPSIDIFESFDELLLMKLGGQVIYAGPLGKNSCHLVDYFEAVPGVPKIKEGQNPAAWMLEISTPTLEATLDIDFADIYSSSLTYRKNKEMIEAMSHPPPGSLDLSFDTKYARSFTIQFMACFWKQYWSYWRNPSYNGVRFFTTIVMALLFGTLFWNRGQEPKSQGDIFNALGSVYCSAFFLGFTIGATVQPVIAVERTVLYRERAAGMYSALSYAFGQVAVETIYVAAQSVLFCLISYPMIGFSWQAGKFLWFVFLMFMCFLYFAVHGMMSIAITPAYPVAGIVTILFYNFWNIFSGFLIYRPMLPKWWKWCYWTSPVAWSIYGLITSQYGDNEQLIRIPGGPSIAVKDYLKNVMGFESSFLGYVAIAHVGFVVVFALAFALGIRFLNFQKR